MALAIGATVPWIILSLLARPGMPVAVAYLFIYQWLQVFARVLQSIVDGEPWVAGLRAERRPCLLVHVGKPCRPGAGLAFDVGIGQAADCL